MSTSSHSTRKPTMSPDRAPQLTITAESPGRAVRSVGMVCGGKKSKEMPEAMPAGRLLFCVPVMKNSSLWQPWMPLVLAHIHTPDWPSTSLQLPAARAVFGLRSLPDARATPLLSQIGWKVVLYSF